MTTESVMAWVKTLSPKATNYYCGFLDSKKDKSFGVYQLKESRAREVAIGKATKTESKGISILVHWNHSTRETDNAAAALYDSLAAASAAVIGGKNVNYIKLLNNEPVDVGTDENGVCERVIEFIIYYERS